MLIRYSTPDLINNKEGYRGGKEATKPTKKIFTNELSLKKIKRKKRRKPELIEHLRNIRNSFGKEWFIAIKTKESSDGSFIQCESDNDAYLEQLSLKKYLKNLNKHLIEDLKDTEQLKGAKFPWKVCFIMVRFLEYEENNKDS